jgi:hypothetical protein
VISHRHRSGFGATELLEVALLRALLQYWQIGCRISAS